MRGASFEDRYGLLGGSREAFKARKDEGLGPRLTKPALPVLRQTGLGSTSVDVFDAPLTGYRTPALRVGRCALAS